MLERKWGEEVDCKVADAKIRGVRRIYFTDWLNLSLTQVGGLRFTIFHQLNTHAQETARQARQAVQISIQEPKTRRKDTGRVRLL